MNLTLELRGGICGAIWWPVGAVCGHPLRSFDLDSERGRFNAPFPLWQCIGTVAASAVIVLVFCRVI